MYFREALFSPDGPEMAAAFLLVLETAYGFPRNEILDTVEKILQTAEFEIEDKDAAWQALQDSRQYQVDFSDSLIGRQNKIMGCEHTLTF